MTYADGFMEEGQEEQSTYPTAFGITFTPKVGGALIAVLGLLGATYLLVNQVKPAWDNYQALQTTVADKEAQIEQKAAIQKRIEQTRQKLEAAKRTRSDVFAFFGNEPNLDTLLLDLNSVITSRQGKLQKFEPQVQPEGTNIVQDGSLGAGVNGKLKREVYNVEFEGTFDQVLSTLRSIERLPLLLRARDFRAEVGQGETPQKFVVNQQGRAVPSGQPTIRASFKLEALLPLTEEEAAKAATPPPPAQ
jgi:type IV pilus assembly protein PilO